MNHICFMIRISNLPVSKHDVFAMNKELKQIGFEVTVCENSIKSEFLKNYKHKLRFHLRILSMLYISRVMEVTLKGIIIFIQWILQQHMS